MCFLINCSVISSNVKMDQHVYGTLGCAMGSKIARTARTRHRKIVWTSAALPTNIHAPINESASRKRGCATTTKIARMVQMKRPARRATKHSTVLLPISNVMEVRDLLFSSVIQVF